jgi:archaeosine-15-forming tRNA-guanine transglycosylase
VVMPRLGGAELAERRWPSRPDLRVLFMTGYAEFSGDGKTLPVRHVCLRNPF